MKEGRSQKEFPLSGIDKTSNDRISGYVNAIDQLNLRMNYLYIYISR